MVFGKISSYRSDGKRPRSFLGEDIQKGAWGTRPSTMWTLLQPVSTLRMLFLLRVVFPVRNDDSKEAHNENRSKYNVK